VGARQCPDHAAAERVSAALCVGEPLRQAGGVHGALKEHVTRRDGEERQNGEKSVNAVASQPHHESL
jgi:hypothetical protein